MALGVCLLSKSGTTIIWATQQGQAWASEVSNSMLGAATALAIVLISFRADSDAMDENLINM